MIERWRFSTRGLRPLAWFLLCCTLLMGPLASSSWAAKGMKPLEFKQGYLRVLGVLATGDLERALDELTELEMRAAGDEQAWRFVDNLWRLKLQVIRDLLPNQSPDLLMPVIVMHHDAYFLYTDLERPYLAQHSRTMAGELSEVYAERSGTASAAAFAGWTLSSFGAFMWSPSNIGSSADLFFRTYLVDPGNRIALQGLAAAYERAGDYDKAIEYLMLALAQEPGDPEILLRLALCQLRQDEKTADAIKPSLAKLAGQGNPDWIRSVAYQELARVHLAADETESAEALLRQGLSELPGDQQLSLQLAGILDRQRRRSESHATLDAIRIGGWEADSPRKIYDFWTPPDFDRIRAELRQETQKGTAALAASLSTLAPAGAGS